LLAAYVALQNYSNHDIVAFLESIGASFGACQNAYTSADETCYTLMVPTDKWELVDKSLAVMAEFAFRIRLLNSP
jgi:predicted Zn-dependent peptidase